MNRPQYYEYDRPEVLEAIPLDASRVLDVGCGSGRLGEQLKHRQDATVWGIEVVQEVAERAIQRLDRVWNTSVEQALNDIPPESLDCIVAADVLEHLIDPWTVLAELRSRLVPGGTIVASIPNVGHWDVLRDLLEGTWRYTREGLLDRTHLRFFTRRSVSELFWTAGLAIREVTAIHRNPGSVPSSMVAVLQKAGLRVTRLPEEGQAFQYRVVAERRKLPGTWPRVGIVVLDSGGSDDTLACLASLRHLTYAPVDIVVVDSESVMGSTDAIVARFPEVAVLQAGRKGGCAAGSNLGIGYALERGAEYVLLLNNRVTVDRALLDRLVETAWVTPEAGLWGPRVCYSSRPDTVWGTDFKWDLRQMDFVMQSEGDLAGGVDTVHKVDSLLGCAMLVRSDVFKRVGTFAPEYHSRWGAIDFCARATEMGFSCLVVPAALIWHKIEAPIEEEPSVMKEYFDTRDRLLWGRRHGRRRKLSGVRRHVLREIWKGLPRGPGWTGGARKLYWWGWALFRESREPLLRARLRALFDDLLGAAPSSSIPSLPRARRSKI
jgi:methionine biosynthesis protein MetW